MVLRRVAPLLTNIEQIDRIQKFANENGLNSNEEFRSALENARFNSKWAEEKVPIVMHAIRQMNSSNE